MMVGRPLSYWEGNFSGTILNFGRVMKFEVFWKEMYHVSHIKEKRDSKKDGRLFSKRLKCSNPLTLFDLENHRTISISMRCFMLYTFQPCCSCHCHDQGFWMVCTQSLGTKTKRQLRTFPCAWVPALSYHIYSSVTWILKCC